jgi:YHS domain-containing protein
MLDLNLTVAPVGSDGVTAGYSCPCGCTPATTYRRGGATATEGCCCGNEFAVGPDAAARIRPRDGYEALLADVPAPWGERVPVAWAIGPSTHAAANDHETPADEQQAHADTAIDPVCGMTVDRAASVAKGLHTRQADIDVYFCGKGCKLEFDDDPERYLDPSYVPSM